MNDELYDNNARDLVIDIKFYILIKYNNLNIYICCIIDHSTVQWLHMYVCTVYTRYTYTCIADCSKEMVIQK